MSENPFRHGAVDARLHDAIAGRRSIRKFLPQPIDRDTVSAVLRLASRSASGVNAQPWNVYVVMGEKRAALTAAVRQAAEDGDRMLEYDYSPTLWGEYLNRQRKVGFDLYAKYGIARGDMAARMQASLRNFDFFGAPVGLFFTMDNRFKYGQWLDIGIFMDSVMISARLHGLDTCPQQAWCNFGPTIRRILEIPEDNIIVCGMSLGLKDRDAAENTLETERVCVSEFAIFRE
jgi:nitroreductase